MTINYPYWNNNEVISSDKLNSMVQAIVNGDPLAVKVSNATKNDVNQIISYLSSLHNSAKTNLNSATSTSDFDTAYTDMMSLVSNRIGSYANDDTVDLYSTGIRASIITFLQAYDSMMSSDRLNNKNTDKTLSSRIDNEAQVRSDADTSINNSLNAIKANGGGRNLLRGTRDFSGDWYNPGNYWTKTSDMYNGLSIAETNDPWVSPTQFYPVKRGETYTFSLFARYTSGTGSSKINIMLDYNPENGHAQAWVNPNYLACSLDTNWKKYSFTFTVTQDGYIKPRMSRTDSNNNTLQVCGFMLEKGAIAHDWQPAPEDIDTNINTKINSITDNVGGRNLVIGTGSEYIMGYGIPNTVWQDGYAYLKLPLNTYGTEVLPQDPHTFFYTLTKGATYTQTIWLETDAVVKKLNAILITWCTYGSGHDAQPATLVRIGQNRYKIVSTYTWPGKSDNNVRLFGIFYLGSTFDLTTGTYLKFGKLKLEYGSVSTDWSPAPEDTDANINTKINSITNNGGGRNLLRYSTNNGGKFQPNTSRIDNYIIYHASTVYMTQGQQYTVHADASSGLVWSGTHDSNKESNNVALWLTDESEVSQIISDANTGTRTTFTWNNPSGTYYLRVNTYKSDNSGYVEKVMLEKGVVAHDWQLAPEDFDNYTPGRTITLPNNGSYITVKDDRIIHHIYLPTYFTDYTNATDLNSLATSGECDNLFIPSATMATLNSRPTNPDTNAPLTGDCFYSCHYAYSGTTVRAFQKIYSCDYNYIFIRSYNGSSQSWTNWSCLTPYA